MCGCWSLNTPGTPQLRLLGDSGDVPGDQSALGRRWWGETLPSLLLTIVRAVIKCKYRCHQTETSPKHKEPGPKHPKIRAEVSLSMQGPRGTATGWEEPGDADPLWLGLLLALPCWKCCGSSSSSAGGAGRGIFREVLLPGGWRLCLAEHRDPQGVHCSSPFLLPALPLPTSVPSASRDGHCFCAVPGAAGAGTTPPRLPCIAGHRTMLSS